MRYKMGMDPAAALGGLWEIPPRIRLAVNVKPDIRSQR